MSCHEVGKQASNTKCLTCHAAIGQRLQKQRGFHATVMAEKSRSCAACHSEHNGLDFALIHWEKGEANFDHQQARYALEGKHAKVACRDCHRPEFVQEKFTEDPNVRVSKTFLGLSQNCISCHADEHRGQLVTSCERCHDVNAWRPAQKFSHAHAKFALTGMHLKVACAKCHPEILASEKVGKETIAAFVKYTGLSFSNCIPCHADPHRGGFGLNCVKCHNPESWKKIPTGAFNHDVTDFPLRGMHRTLGCEKCHAGGNFKKKLAHQFCRDCHQDAHAGQFARRADQGKCESCHTEAGFTPSRFTLAAHQQLSFSLQGAHLAIACRVCHHRQTTGKLAGKLLFAFPDHRCQVCHRDEHDGQFKSRMSTGSCEVCHRHENWRETGFDHNTARFALVGAHRKVACSKCHPQERRLEFETSKRQTTMISKERVAFISATTNFATNQPWVGEMKAEFTRYRPLAFRCVDCHQDVHRGQFGKKEETRCEKCHQSTLWTELLFIHNRDSAFKLDGAHEKVPCEKCHFELKLKDQTVVVVYKPLRKECAACHR